MTDDVEGLIERLEKATGPDRELDAMLYVIVVQERQWREDGMIIYAQKSPRDLWRVGYIDPGEHSRNFSFSELSVATMVPTYTSSIDAALALTERLGIAFDAILDDALSDVVEQALERADVGGDANPKLSALPLAILLATLRAKRSA
jgi:hypothetical protein